MTTNAYCEALGIPVPTVEAAKESSDANYYSLLIAFLLERGEPVTLPEAARRFEDAGIALASASLASLKRCKPGRPPIYRDGDLYALDPHDGEADLWAFRLGLRRSKASRLRVVRPPPPPLPSADRPLTAAQLDEAWGDRLSTSWSAQRVALCVLDAHGRPMDPEEVVSFVRARSRWSPVSAGSAAYWRRGAPIHVREDGHWEIDPLHPAVASAREAVRRRVETVRKWTEKRPDPAVVEAVRRSRAREREEHGRRLAAMRRVVLHPFPASRPLALALVDVERRAVASYVGDEMAAALAKIDEYEIIAARDVRRVFGSLAIDPKGFRLADLAPPQKTKTLNRRGRTLRITTDLLVQGSCGISRPFGEESRMRRYLDSGDHGKLRRRLEADAKSLHALYQYGRLHGAVRLRWGFLDEWIPAPWVHRDEPRLLDLMDEARDRRLALEVVTGNAPGWAEPWARARRAHVEKEGWNSWLIDEDGIPVDERDVQLARLAPAEASDP